MNKRNQLRETRVMGSTVTFLSSLVAHLLFTCCKSLTRNCSYKWIIRKNTSVMLITHEKFIDHIKNIQSFMKNLLITQNISITLENIQWNMLLCHRGIPPDDLTNIITCCDHMWYYSENVIIESTIRPPCSMLITYSLQAIYT